ncbi:hypothetical protein EPA93_43110 [Ktedonosporobacter rubrisoli]|uniref:Uncharacterized protein n=1 Tax=Ktedonosporobacter rubrisoli TaxID=2509675 RepID=A0A4P6K4F1_KTERU|nr:hypothetical protein [Ktedonosporobacter rubrisoli]QBD82406.1 hypothetical protein EPA93_43110 [Ktedonosporobacter rubrisoli]
MPICLICDDTGLQNSDSEHPEFCFCSAGKKARRQWEMSKASEKQGKGSPKPASFIDIAQLEQVNASVDAMRASLLGSAAAETTTTTKHAAVQLLYQVAHPGHEVSVGEATQLYDLAKVLEVFLSGLTPIGRNLKR